MEEDAGVVTTVPPTGDGATVRRSAPAFIDAGQIIGSRYEVRRLLGRRDGGSLTGL